MEPRYEETAKMPPFVKDPVQSTTPVVQMDDVSVRWGPSER